MSLFDGSFGDESTKLYKATKKANELIETIRDIPKQLDLVLDSLLEDFKNKAEEVEKVLLEQKSIEDKLLEVKNIKSGLGKLFSGQ